ncbi:MAG: HhoA/HhoB/HtrA family serine endopeptidase [Elainellaceae cyanobacterium]
MHMNHDEFSHTSDYSDDNTAVERPSSVKTGSTSSPNHRLKPSQLNRLQRSLGLVLLGAGIATTGTYFAWNPNARTLPSAVAQESAPVPSTALVPANSNFVTNTVQQVGPAVVRIDAARTVTSQLPEQFNNPFFRQFFGDQLPQQSEQVERGVGSGFIITDSGQIVTNAHVVAGADTVNVTLKDGRTFEGRVLGADSVTDVAVIKIEANDLPTIKLSNSDQIQAGEWAIAIGNPLGLDSTVTVGIISATGRSSGQVGVPDKRVNFIQTDAAINPGNSGGPLLNDKGEVIGMNTAIRADAQGIGFAIPINTVQQIADQLVANGKVEHPYLGVQMVTLTPEVQQELNSNPNSGISVDETQGILVARVMPGSPAAEAGLRAGDVIQSVNGQEVTDASELQNLVEESQVGGNLRIELKRNGQDVNVSAQLQEFPADRQQG